MNDFIKQPLTIGDRVVHGVGGRRGGLSGPYFIIAFTPQMVRVARSQNATEGTIVHPSCLVKVSA